VLEKHRASPRHIPRQEFDFVAASLRNPASSFPDSALAHTQDNLRQIA
jgi:hypothetical protein